jgi:hypothetical protein
MVGLALLAFAWNWRVVDISQDLSTRRLGEAILLRVEPGALVFGWWDSIPPIQYLQLVEGQRPDVQAVNRFLISPQDLDQVILKEVIRRPVYIDHVPVSLLTRLTASPAGTLYRLQPARARPDQAYPYRPGRY